MDNGSESRAMYGLLVGERAVCLHLEVTADPTKDLKLARKRIKEIHHART